MSNSSVQKLVKNVLYGSFRKYEIRNEKKLFIYQTRTQSNEDIILAIKNNHIDL